MNYPIWSLPAPGLLIAAVAILHVFISHFAVGGGLFLVLGERKARREGDAAFLAYLKYHSRFFILLTLVLGAITGVGIWFTIGLVHPQATSSLINIFVWAWAIEWTFFATEIAAALVYYYGWDRLAPKTHQAVGWVYFVSAWFSLVVINGILTFMLTPGSWLATGSFWDGLLNPTYWPSVAARTFTAVGLAGLYALLTAAAIRDAALKVKVARYAGAWIIAMTVALPASVAWYLVAAGQAGIPVGEILGAPGNSATALATAVVSGSPFGHPVALTAARVVLAGSAATLMMALLIVFARARTYGRPAALVLLACAFAAMGGGEWVREDLRKPYVLGGHMLVNGVRLPRPAGSPQPPPEALAAFGADRFTLDAVRASGVLQASHWVRKADANAGPVGRLEAEGAEVFRLACSACHTINGYLAIRPLVAGKSMEALSTVIVRLAQPVDAQGREAAWSDPHLQLQTWRGRRMPPFVGSDSERESLAFYLARLGGAPATLPVPRGQGGPGHAYFEEQCSACHGPASEFPIGGRGRTASELYEMLGRLPQINEMMPPFEGPDEVRRALADYLASLPGPRTGGAR